MRLTIIITFLLLSFVVKGQENKVGVRIEVPNSPENVHSLYEGCFHELEVTLTGLPNKDVSIQLEGGQVIDFKNRILQFIPDSSKMHMHVFQGEQLVSTLTFGVRKGFSPKVYINTKPTLSNILTVSRTKIDDLQFAIIPDDGMRRDCPKAARFTIKGYEVMLIGKDKKLKYQTSSVHDPLLSKKAAPGDTLFIQILQIDRLTYKNEHIAIDHRKEFFRINIKK